MIYGFLVFVDLLTAFVIVGAHFDLVSKLWLFYHTSYLIVKGGWFWRDPLSWIDIAIGLWMLMMIVGAKSVFSYIAAAYLLYKVGMWLAYR